MDINHDNKLMISELDLKFHMEEHLLHHQIPFDSYNHPCPNYPSLQTHQISFSSSSSVHVMMPALSSTPSANDYYHGNPNLDRDDDHDNHHHDHEEEEDQQEEELGDMKEMMYKIAAMQPVDIDPATIRKPKRRNVRISDDPQSVAARHRRERISEKIRILQRLVPGGTKMDTASMLDEAIRYVKFLKRQIRLLQSGNQCHNNVVVNTTSMSSSLPYIPAKANGSAYMSYSMDQQVITNINESAGHGVGGSYVLSGSSSGFIN